jgi:dynein heavy chain
MNALNNAHKNGGWVLLQNIHLTIDWTSGPLEKKVDKLAEGAHPEFRYYLCYQVWKKVAWLDLLGV